MTNFEKLEAALRCAKRLVVLTLDGLLIGLVVLVFIMGWIYMTGWVFHLGWNAVQ